MGINAASRPLTRRTRLVEVLSNVGWRASVPFVFKLTLGARLSSSSSSSTNATFTPKIGRPKTKNNRAAGEEEYLYGLAPVAAALKLAADSGNLFSAPIFRHASIQPPQVCSPK